MNCPYCSNVETKVVDKRNSEEGVVRRRRECLKCEKRFTTYERVDMVDMTVLKKNGTKESFDREKLKRGILPAAGKRISIEEIDKAIDEIESTLRKKDTTEVTSQQIGDLVMKKLKKLDKISYIRFASVYREFEDLTDMQDEIKELIKKEKKTDSE